MSEGTKTHVPLRPTEVWTQWLETTTGMWRSVAETNTNYLIKSYSHFTKSFQWNHPDTNINIGDASKLQLASLSTLPPSLPLPQVESAQKREAPVHTVDTQGRMLAALPALGARVAHAHTITEADIALFAQVSGDYNPIHLDSEYAARSLFGGRIAHGLFVASLISALLGNDLPGPGTIYMAQTLKFLAPVRIDDTIIVSVEVIAIREEKRILTLRTDCTNQQGTLVLTGEATCKYMQEINTV